MGHRFMLRIFLFSIGGLIAVVIGAAAWLGAFMTLEVKEQVAGPFTIIYLPTASSDMNEVGRITDTIAGRLGEAGVTGAKPFDVFVDAPSEENPNMIGFVLPAAQARVVQEKDASLLVTEIPAQLCMVVRFPWKNQLSFIVGYFKVDPVLTRHREAHGYDKVEAFAMNLGDIIQYMQPIRRTRVSAAR